jgi:transposase
MNSSTMFVGLDISKLKHDVAAVDENKNTLMRSVVIQDCYQDFQSLVEKLNSVAHKHNKTRIAIGMEATADYWKNIFYFLKKQPQGYSVTVINPVQTRAYAKTELRRAKTDPINAKDIACFMAEKRPAPWADHLLELENLKDIDRCINQLKKLSTMLINKLRLELTKVAPEIEKATSTFKNQQMLALLAEYPTAEALDFASFEQLGQLRYGPHNRAFSKAFLEKAKALAHHSIAFKTGHGSACVVQSLVKTITDIRNQKAKLQKDAQALFSNLVGHESILASIPGITRETAIMFQAYIGDISRFSNSKKFVAFFGMNPSIDMSGKRKRASYLQKKGEPAIRHKLFMAVLPMIRGRIHPVYPYYRRLVDSGKPKLVAICAAMRKLLTIMYAMLKNNESFDLRKT